MWAGRRSGRLAARGCWLGWDGVGEGQGLRRCGLLQAAAEGKDRRGRRRRRVGVRRAWTAAGRWRAGGEQRRLLLRRPRCAACLAVCLALGRAAAGQRARGCWRLRIRSGGRRSGWALRRRRQRDTAAAVTLGQWHFALWPRQLLRGAGGGLSLQPHGPTKPAKLLAVALGRLLLLHDGGPALQRRVLQAVAHRRQGWRRWRRGGRTGACGASATCGWRRGCGGRGRAERVGE